MRHNQNTTMTETTKKGGIAAAPKQTPGGIPVHCRFDKLMPATELQRNPKNYRQHPASQIRVLAGLIRQNGWRKPVVVSDRSGLIITGHGSTMAAISMQDSVPVEFQHFTDEAAENAAMIGDNKATEGAKDDEAALAALIKELGGINPEAVGMGADELERLTAMANGTATPKAPRAPGKSVISYNLIFDTLDQQQRFYDLLTKLKKDHPDLTTIASRIDRFITAATAEPAPRQ